MYIFRCIDAEERFRDQYEIDLTLGKLYNVSHIGDNIVTINGDDTGDTWEYAKDRFVNVIEERNNIIDDILK